MRKYENLYASTKLWLASIDFGAGYKYCQIKTLYDYENKNYYRGNHSQ